MTRPWLISALRRIWSKVSSMLLALAGSNSFTVYAFSGLLLKRFINAWSSGDKFLSKSSLSFDILLSKRVIVPC